MGDYVNCDSSEETTFKDSTLTDVGVELGTNSDTTRRVRGVRFLAELTISINHTSDSSPTVHSTCEEPSRRAPPVVGPAGSSFYGKEQRTCDRDQGMSREPVQFQRWRTDRREREAKMEQNIKWLREEIVSCKNIFEIIYFVLSDLLVSLAKVVQNNNWASRLFNVYSCKSLNSLAFKIEGDEIATIIMIFPHPFK